MNLYVCLDAQVAGYIDATANRVTFRYSDAWLAGANSYPLSYSLPLRPLPYTGAAVLNVLWGLLPDNPRTLDAWGRRFQVSARNPVALLAHVGEDCAGAVQLVSEARLPEILGDTADPPDVSWLPEAEFISRIRNLTRDGADGRVGVDEGQFSLGGAQVKTALHYDAGNDRWGVPRGRTPTTHILKPVANDFDGFAENEHFCLTLARRVGLIAARSQWVRIGGIPTLISERYDRVQRQGRWLRVHQEDACQAMGVHPDSKYENEGGPGLPELMSLLNAGDEPETDRRRLMRTACFNYLVAATDAHAKNFSLLHARGLSRPSMRLAPLYDIASAWPYPRSIPHKKMKLAMKIGGHYKIAEVLPRHFEQLARASQFPADALLTMLRELAQSLPDQAADLAVEIREEGMVVQILDSLIDALARHCKTVLSRLDRHSQVPGRPYRNGAYG